MGRFPVLAAWLAVAVVTAWWEAFLFSWGRIDDAVDEKNGLIESDFAGDYEPATDYVNADVD